MTISSRVKDGMTPELNHFLALARRGRQPAASGGERRAAALAECIVENVPGLDATALDGLLEFVVLVRGRPSTMRDALDASKPAR